jgi:hypothetical protein
MTEHNIEIPCNTEVVIRVSCIERTCGTPDPIWNPGSTGLGVVDTICFPPHLFDPVVVEVPAEPVIEPILVIDPVEVPAEPVTEPVVEVPVTEPVAIDPILVVDPIVVVEPTPNPVIPSEPVVEPVVVVDPVINPVQTLDPTPVVTQPVVEVPVVTEPIAELPPVTLPPVLPVPPRLPPVLPEHCFCNLDSPLSLADFAKQLAILTKGLLYPSESDFPIEVIAKSFSSRMPPIKGIELRTLDRVIPSFLRSIDPDDQQTGNVERAALATRWQGLYQFIKTHASVTAWHYPVKGKKYTHELFVLLLHPQGTVALKAKLVET